MVPACKVRCTVHDAQGAKLHDRWGTFNAVMRAGHRKAQITRLNKRLMRVYAGQWQRIEIITY